MTDYYSEFQGTFSDFSTLIIFGIFIIQVLITDSEEMLEFDVTLYFALMFLFCCFACSFVAWLSMLLCFRVKGCAWGGRGWWAQVKLLIILDCKWLLLLFLLLLLMFCLLCYCWPKEFKLGFSSKAKEYDPDSKLGMLGEKDAKKDKKFFLKPYSLLETDD